MYPPSSKWKHGWLCFWEGNILPFPYNSLSYRIRAEACRCRSPHSCTFKFPRVVFYGQSHIRKYTLDLEIDNGWLNSIPYDGVSPTARSRKLNPPPLPLLDCKHFPLRGWKWSSSLWSAEAMFLLPRLSFIGYALLAQLIHHNGVVMLSRFLYQCIIDIAALRT